MGGNSFLTSHHDSPEQRPSSLVTKNPLPPCKGRLAQGFLWDFCGHTAGPWVSEIDACPLSFSALRPSSLHSTVSLWLPGHFGGKGQSSQLPHIPVDFRDSWRLGDSERERVKECFGFHEYKGVLGTLCYTQYEEEINIPSHMRTHEQNLFAHSSMAVVISLWLQA